MANLGYQFDIPGKRESQLMNCLYQLIQWYIYGVSSWLPGPLWVVPFLGGWTWVAYRSKPVVSSIPPRSPSISVPNLCVPGLAGDGFSDGLIHRRVSWSNFFLFPRWFWLWWVFVFCFLNHKYRKKIRIHSPNRTEKFSPGIGENSSVSNMLLHIFPQFTLNFVPAGSFVARGLLEFH